MRIDDRKVNGRVLLDALDPVDGFNILVESTGATWQWRGSPLDPEVAAIRLDAMLEDTVPLGVRFCITAAEGQSYKVLSLPVYTVNKTAKTITIDITALVADKKLTIALDTGVITVASNIIM